MAGVRLVTRILIRSVGVRGTLLMRGVEGGRGEGTEGTDVLGWMHENAGAKDVIDSVRERDLSRKRGRRERERARD